MEQREMIMMKKLGLTTIVLSALLLNGCGGSDEKKLPQAHIDLLNTYTTIYTFHNVNSDFCSLAMNKLVISTKSSAAIFASSDVKINCSVLNRTSNCSALDTADFAIENNIQDISTYEDSNWDCAVGLK